MSRALAGRAEISSVVESPSGEDGLLPALPVLALLCLQAGLFVWMATRGIDFTDESYYLLSYLHWREFTATATFFGAYFEWPFRLLGQRVGVIRIFGMTMLVCAGGFFTWRVMVFGGDRDGCRPHPLPFVIVGMVSALHYYSYVKTLRAPSYNLLVLFCLLVATGLLLTLVEGRGSRQRHCATALVYGLVVGACTLAKATSAVAMVLCHAVFFAAFSRQRRTLELVALALAGAAINFVLLQLMHPGWFQVLRNGVTLITALDNRYTSIQLAPLGEAILRGGVRLLPALVITALVFAVVARRWGVAQRNVLSWLVMLLVAGIMLTIQIQGYGKFWWALLVFGTALLWLAKRRHDTFAPPAREVPATLGLSILLFALPIAYSIGTNASLPGHTQMAAVFGMIGIMLPLRRLRGLALIHRSALAGALTLLCLPTLVSQLRSLTDPEFTYRLRVGLMDQRLPVVLGVAGDSLLVDTVTRESIDTLARGMRDAGYTAGEPILDVTGDGPGLVYALGGRPVGVAWLIGGYAGSDRVAALVLNSVPVATLRQAWVVSADDNPRALRSWEPLLRERAGGTSHRLAVSVPYVAQYRDGLPVAPVALSLWKPTNPVRSMALEKMP